MISLLESVILGIIQGLTEWFPVSSSGHLALYQNIFGLDVPVLFDIYLHLGTLLVLFIFFWKDIVKIASDVLCLRSETDEFEMGKYILIATLVTGVVGFLFYDFISGLFLSLRGIGFGFLFTGLILITGKNIKPKKKEIGVLNSLIIGLFQGIALIPGVSRSGSTIGIGIIRGIDRVKLARFSFLLSIPAIIGAGAIDTLSNYSGAIPFLAENVLAVVLGVGFSAIVGYTCLSGLMKIIEKGKFHYFAYYCFAIGIITLILA